MTDSDIMNSKPTEAADRSTVKAMTAATLLVGTAAVVMTTTGFAPTPQEAWNNLKDPVGTIQREVICR